MRIDRELNVQSVPSYAVMQGARCMLTPIIRDPLLSLAGFELEFF